MLDYIYWIIFVIVIATHLVIKDNDKIISYNLIIIDILQISNFLSGNIELLLVLNTYTEVVFVFIEIVFEISKLKGIFLRFPLIIIDKENCFVWQISKFLANSKFKPSSNVIDIGVSFDSILRILLAFTCVCLLL